MPIKRHRCLYLNRKRESELLNTDKIKNYTIIEKKELPEVSGTGYLLRHDKTKARVMLIDNADENKVFCIGFRTPPSNSKGVQHIIEHTVLCGSKKYPVKDPFAELCKSSLNTFLNAMTYPDKTVYPVASCNDKDFQNLMDVYLDAVFNPDIYDIPEIFKQEGWHYEMESVDSPLTINGVVYNEMKGSFSSADAIVEQSIEKSLYPDSIYSLVSGGLPEDIPSLTREEYLDCHSKYYHPSNSYIYLYGDMDFNEKLDYIDKEYLAGYDYLEVDSEIKEQKAFDAPKEYTSFYSLSEDEDLEDNTYLTYNTVIGKSTDITLNTAFDVLCYTLLDAPGAPLKKAIVDAGICAEVESNYEDEIMQPEFSIVARNSDEKYKDKFISIINDTLEEIISKGLDKKALTAAINHFDFRHKEANYGRYPKGLMLILDAFGSWLYDESEAFTRFSLNGVFDVLRSHVDDGYFEDIIRKYILENNHKSYGVTKPAYNLGRESEEKLREKLEAIRSKMTDEEKQKVVEDTINLKAYQEEPSSEEDLMKIPVLTIEDIKKEARKPKNRETFVDGVKTIHHDIFTNGISYVNLNFDANDLVDEEIYAMSLLCEILKFVDTDLHTSRELSGEIDLETGGIGFGVGVFAKENGEPYSYFFGKFKSFDDKLKEGFALLKEILFSSHITDRKRLKEIVAETKSNIRLDLVESGQITSTLRAASYISKTNYIKEKQEGIDFYRFLDDIDKDFDNRYEGLAKLLKGTLKKLLRKDALTVSFTSDKKPEDVLSGLLGDIYKDFSDEKVGNTPEIKLSVKNEGFTAASDVQYVASVGDYKKEGLAYNGALNVLRIIFGYDYLWIRVRVKGGAYGCSGSFSRSGIASMYSYRDPNLKETIDIFNDAYKYVQEFDVSDREMTKYVIGTIGSMDTPFTPQSEASFSFACYLMGITDEQLQRERDEVINADQSVIRSLAPYVKVIADSNVICAVGNEDKIKSAADIFGKVENIYAGR